MAGAPISEHNIGFPVRRVRRRHRLVEAGIWLHIAHASVGGVSPPVVRTVVVGDLMTDVVAHAHGQARPGTDTSASVRTHGGGSGANTAAWLASAGTATAFVGRVGDDDLGHAALDHLRESGVEPYVTIDKSRPTGTCVVVVFPDGQRSKFPDVGANAGLRPADLPDDVFVEGRHLHLTGYPLLSEKSRLAALASLDLARLRHMTASVDPASSGPLADVGPDMFLSWTAGVDLLLVNAQEATTLTGRVDPTDAGRALVGSYRNVVVKLGSEGAMWLSRDMEPVMSPALAVTLADTTGAGDAFAAGFIPAWLDGSGPEAALAAGNRLAAKAVSMEAARP